MFLPACVLLTAHASLALSTHAPAYSDPITYTTLLFLHEQQQHVLPVLNEAGDVGFVNVLQIESEHAIGIWANASDNPNTLILNARVKPSRVKPSRFAADFVEFVVFASPHHNIKGDIAFTSALPTQTTETKLSIFAYSAAHEALYVIAREGDQFDVDDNPNREDKRTIARINLVSSFDGFPDDIANSGIAAGITDEGEVIIYLEFTDNTSGLFLATPPHHAPGPCDWNRNATTNVDDFFAFLSAYFVDAADFDGNGSVNEDDFFGFISCYFSTSIANSPEHFSTSNRKQTA